MAQRAAWPAMESGERSAKDEVVSPLSVTAVEESFSFLQRMELEAYRADASGSADEFIAAMALASVNITEIIKPGEPMWMVVDRLTEVYLAKLKRSLEFDENDPILHNPFNDRAVEFLKKLYKLSDYLETELIVLEVYKLFRKYKPCPSPLRLVLDQILHFESQWMTLASADELTAGLLRGQIMLLLNILPRFICSTEEEVDKWKAHHLAELYVKPPTPPPPNTNATESTVDMEWESYKPAAPSKLLQMAGDAPPMNSDNANIHDKEDTTLQAQPGSGDNVDTAVKTLGLNWSTLLGDRRLRSVSEYFKLCFDGFAEVLMVYADEEIVANAAVFKTSLKSLLRPKLEAFQKYPFDTVAGTTKAMDQAAESIYKACKSDKSAAVDVSSTLYQEILLELYAICRDLVFKKIESRGPMAYIATNDHPPVAVSQTVLSDFKKYKKAHKMRVPWSSTSVSGTGTLKVVDDKGFTFDLKASYAPDGMRETLIVHESRPFDSRVRLLKQYPAIIPLKQLTMERYNVMKSSTWYATCFHKEKGTLYLIVGQKFRLLPLTQLPVLARLITTWASLEERFSEIHKTNKQRFLNFEK